MNLWLKILLCVLGTVALGFLSGWLFTAPGGWYRSLEHPPGTPPASVFGPVWTLLYTLIGISLALVWHRAPAGPAKRRASLVFFIQLLLNLAWTPVFFGARQPDIALVVIVLLLVAIISTIVRFRALDRLAAWLLVPYLLWVGYAAYLNAGYAWLNG